MSVEDPRLGVVSRLRAALDKKILPSAAQAQGARLLERLQTGVSVVLLGPPGAGKTSLCHAMMERPANPQTMSGNVVRYGAREANPSHGPDIRPPHGTISDVALDLPLFDSLQILDVGSLANPEQNADLWKWAMAQSDIVLWCTTGFDALEQSFWSSAPDHLKDHSFLVMTKADKLAQEGSLTDQIARLQDIASEEFHSLFPTAALQVSAALAAGGNASDQILAASGIKALRDTLRKLTREGRRADLDGALLFLRQNGIDTDGEVVPAMPLEAQKDVKPVKEGEPAQEKQPVLPDTGEPCKTESGIHSAVLAMLRDKARQLVSEMPDAPGDQACLVLQACEVISEELISLASRDDWGNEPLKNEVFSAADKLVLISLEDSTESAADAATIMLQLSRDLQQRQVY